MHRNPGKGRSSSPEVEVIFPNKLWPGKKIYYARGGDKTFWISLAAAQTEVPENKMDSSPRSPKHRNSETKQRLKKIFGRSGAADGSVVLDPEITGSIPATSNSL